ncbi:MAG: type I-E CRISPR-associated endonuclease Cas1e [Pyramidobacter sp.]|nr:type I-E CRISPR-associated endonuclease Cas1e [Pyramidobacter sp.]
MAFARLGLESARIPHADRHGLLWLERGNLYVKDGTLRFISAGTSSLEAGTYDIPYQTVSVILLGPGTTISHDVFRLAGKHGVGLMAVGENGVRCYTSPPQSPDTSTLARRQVALWSNPASRRQVVLRMYEIRFGEELPTLSVEALRGIEGSRVREYYKILAQRYGVVWKHRKFDRQNPERNDDINNAVNHAATAVYAAATVAVAATSTIPQLGFIHESSYYAFALDIADLFRMDVTIPIAFQGLRENQKDPSQELERQVRRLAGRTFAREKLIPKMIDVIKELLAEGDGEDEYRADKEDGEPQNADDSRDNQ